MKGRKPKLLLVENAPLAGGCPAAPSWLPPLAQAEWRRAAPQLHARGVLTDDVFAMMESYCIASGQVRECEEVMMREGRLVEGERGQTVHPAHRLQQAAMREARLLACELGISPHRKKAVEEEDKTGGWDSDLLA
ncbi:phage terminase small subunit P27 family [Pararhodospirillum photometricum]|uniref:phage terminase small subunit P27 family n=1 Tax=Pararhodospirillum photometricum TaxID=1084 RepID=UPI000687366D|nr:phage terminase small subunit P27 family [Pararhodospirillum photometricum]